MVSLFVGKGTTRTLEASKKSNCVGFCLASSKGTLGQEKEEEISQLEHIGPMRGNHEMYIQNAGILWVIWDYCHIFVTIQEVAHTRIFQTRKIGQGEKSSTAAINDTPKKSGKSDSIEDYLA